MKAFSVVLVIALLAALAGCEVSKPYVMKVDRHDQNLETGNRGYLKGTPPPVGDRGDLKRPFLAVDIDLPSDSPQPPAEEAIATEEEAVATEEEAVATEEEAVATEEEAATEEAPAAADQTAAPPEEDIK
jgi:hypothetical protein